MTKLIVPIGVLLALACPGCDAYEVNGVEDDEGYPPLIDEKQGAYGGVTLGASGGDVRERFGDPGGAEGFFPLDEEGFTGPVSIPTPGGRPDVMRYEEAAFLVAQKGGVVSLVVSALGTATRAGVAVGGPLGRVREAYDGVRCGEAPAGEALFGGEDPTYPWCRAMVGRVEVFFGGDPIESVTLTRR